MPFKVKNNGQALSKQHHNNFEKVKKTSFRTPEMAKTPKIIKLYFELLNLKSRRYCKLLYLCRE